MSAVIKERPIIRPTFDNSMLNKPDNFKPWLRANKSALLRYWGDLGGSPDWAEFVAIQFDRECLSTPLDNEYHSEMSAP